MRELQWPSVTRDADSLSHRQRMFTWKLTTLLIFDVSDASRDVRAPVSFASARQFVSKLFANVGIEAHRNFTDGPTNTLFRIVTY